MSKSLIQLHEVIVDKNKINYRYSYSSDLNKYFTNCDDLYISYDSDVSEIPKSILAIPWLSNFVVISWFTGSTIIMDEVDQDFVECLSILKKAFSETHLDILCKKSDLIVTNLVKNSYQLQKEAMLFSGGLDAWTTFLKHKDKKFDLITIQGSDIELHDDKKVQLIRTSYQENPLLSDLNVHFISCNFRNFYNQNLEKLIHYNYVDWWTLVQHGLALTASSAPLAYKYGYSNVFIASTFSEKENFLWGSSILDNHIRFGNTTITHDGMEFNRIQKTEFVVKQIDELNVSFALRVCYKHNFSDFNCALCPKCLRMIISLVLYNKNPNEYGFKVDAGVYDIVINQLEKNNFSFVDPIFWSEIDTLIKGDFSFYIFENHQKEKDKMLFISSLLKKKNKKSPNNKIKLFKKEIRDKWLQWKIDTII